MRRLLAALITRGGNTPPEAASSDNDEENAFFSTSSSGFDWEARDDSLPKKQDGRLFPEYLLYCEGLEKPYCRGLLHLLACLLLPFGLVHLVREASGNVVGKVAATLYVVSNIFCYGVSALYHLGKWSPRSEIMLQKWDHCGITILSVGTFVPVSFLLFPQEYAGLFLVVLLGTSGTACWNIVVQNNPSVLRQVLVPASSLLFLSILYATLNRLEFVLYFAVVAFQLAGVVVFVSQRPNPAPKFFGYHEVFHCFVVAAGISVYICNWSIIRRTCQPYEHDNEVVILIYRAFHRIWERPS